MAVGHRACSLHRAAPPASSPRVLARVAGVPLHICLCSLDVIARQGLRPARPRHPRSLSPIVARVNSLGPCGCRPDDAALADASKSGTPAWRYATPPSRRRRSPVPRPRPLPRAPTSAPRSTDPPVMAHRRHATGPARTLTAPTLYLRRPDIHGQPTARL